MQRRRNRKLIRVRLASESLCEGVNNIQENVVAEEKRLSRNLIRVSVCTIEVRWVEGVADVG